MFRTTCQPAQRGAWYRVPPAADQSPATRRPAPHRRRHEHCCCRCCCYSSEGYLPCSSYQYEQVRGRGHGWSNEHWRNRHNYHCMGNPAVCQKLSHQPRLNEWVGCGECCWLLTRSHNPRVVAHVQHPPNGKRQHSHRLSTHQRDHDYRCGHGGTHAHPRHQSP
jgi:hypothetical protein